VAISNPLTNADLISQLLTKATPTERRQYLHEHASLLGLELLVALKTRADQQEQKDPKAARKISQIAAEVAELLDDDIARALAAVIRGNTMRLLGQHQEAVADYERAAALYQASGDKLAAASSQIGQINALTHLGCYDQALELAGRLRGVFDAHDEGLAQAKLDMNLGVLHARLGQHQVALSHYQSARATFAALGDTPRLAMLDANRANLLTDLDDFRGAEELYQSARDAFSAAGMASATAQVDQSIAYLLFAQGEFDSALHLFDQARDIFGQTEQPVAVADVELDMSEVYLRLNLLDEAWAACDRAEPIFRGQGHMLEVGRILLNRALVTMGHGDLAEGSALLAKAGRIFQGEGNAVWSALAQLNRAIHLLRSGRPSEALTLTQGAGDLFERRGLRTRHCLALTLTGDAFQSVGDWDQAEASYGSALAAIEGLDAPWLSYRCHYGLGRVHQRLGALQEAYRAYRRAVHELERVHASFGIEPHRIAFLQDKLAPYEDLILLCLDDGADERVAEAFEYVERAKSRALVDLLAQNLSGRVQPHDEMGRKLASDLERLREELNWYYNRLHDANPEAGQRSPVMIAKAWQEIARLEQQANDLMHHMRVRYTNYLSLRQVQSNSLGAIRECLPPGGLLIEFYMAREATVAFVLSRDNLRVYPNLMPVGQIERWLTAFWFQINKFRYGGDYVTRHASTLRSGVDRCLQALYQGLLAPLEAELADQPLIVIPHGLLHYVPFHALYDGRRYVLEGHSVHTAPSAGVLRLCCDQRPAGNGQALLMGVSDASTPQVIEEVESIGHLLGDATLFTGPRATLDRLKAHAAAQGVIHIASHALFRADNPLFSALRLADGWLNVNDVYQLQLNARLVTLSGCETGVGLVSQGDELIGLSRAFFYAGAPSLVVSLWAVNDDSTALLMQHFYQSLRDGYSVAESLRQAQLRLMARFQHPYYWASFTASGDGRVALHSSTPGFSTL
jgi:tetratricopeptide (TPR) repeat protein